MRVVYKPWGKEQIWDSGGETPYVAKFLHFHSGRQSSLHYHTEKDETLILQEGFCEIVINGHLMRMETNLEYRIQPNWEHQILPITSCILLEISTRETGETVRLRDPYSRGNEFFN